MEEKFEEEKTRDNNVEYNTLVSAVRKAYPGKPPLEVVATAKAKWAELKGKYGMGMFSVSNVNFGKYSTYG